MIIKPWELVERPFWARPEMSEAEAWQEHQSGVRETLGSTEPMNVHALMELWGFEATGWCQGCVQCDAMGFGYLSANMEYRRGPNHLLVWLCSDRLDCMECGDGMVLADVLSLLRLEAEAAGECPGCQLPRA